MKNILKNSSVLFALILLTACGVVENTNQNVNSGETSTGAIINNNVNNVINADLNVNLNANSTMPAQVQSEFLRNVSLIVDQTIESPLIITGEAKGWYFEGSFPVELQDANGKVLTVVPAQAKGDWMTDSFLPFSATINFISPTTPTGKVVLKRDNPSGLPEYDMSYSIPVKFVKAE